MRMSGSSSRSVAAAAAITTSLESDGDDAGFVTAAGALSAKPVAVPASAFGVAQEGGALE